MHIFKQLGSKTFSSQTSIEVLALDFLFQAESVLFWRSNILKWCFQLCCTKKITPESLNAKRFSQFVGIYKSFWRKVAGAWPEPGRSLAGAEKKYKKCPNNPAIAPARLRPSSGQWPEYRQPPREGRFEVLVSKIFCMNSGFIEQGQIL